MEEQVKKKKNKKIWILFILVPMLSLVVGFFVFSFFTETFVFAEKPRPTTTEFTFPMDDLVINLKDSKGNDYLKTKIVVGYALKEDVEKLEEKKFQLRDEIIKILRAKSKGDIMPVENTDELKVEIHTKLNQYFQEPIITDVFITEFLIQ